MESRRDSYAQVLKRGTARYLLPPNYYNHFPNLGQINAMAEKSTSPIIDQVPQASGQGTTLDTFAMPNSGNFNTEMLETSYGHLHDNQASLDPRVKYGREALLSVLYPRLQVPYMPAHTTAAPQPFEHSHPWSSLICANTTAAPQPFEYSDPWSSLIRANTTAAPPPFEYSDPWSSLIRANTTAAPQPFEHSHPWSSLKRANTTAAPPPFLHSQQGSPFMRPLETATPLDHFIATAGSCDILYNYKICTTQYPIYLPPGAPGTFTRSNLDMQPDDDIRFDISYLRSPIKTVDENVQKKKKKQKDKGATLESARRRLFVD